MVSDNGETVGAVLSEPMESLIASKRFSTSKLSALIAALVSSCVVVVLLWIGFQHNSQNEFYDTLTGQVDWRYCIQVATASFVSMFLVSWALTAGIILAVRGGR